MMEYVEFKTIWSNFLFYFDLSPGSLRLCVFSWLIQLDTDQK